MADKCLFAVVEFTVENAVSVVPKSWLICNRKKVSDKCYYPSFGGETTKRDLIRNLTAPKKNWKSFPCRVFQFCQTYEEALQIEDDAQYRSTFESEHDESQRLSESQLTGLEVPTPPNNAIFQFKDEPLHNSSAPGLVYVDQSILGINQVVDPGVNESDNESTASHVSYGADNSTSPDELKQMILRLGNKFESFQSFVAGQFVKIGEDINALLLANPSAQQSQVNNQSVGKKFPLNSAGQLTEFEKYLETDTNKDIAIKLFSSVGGSDVSSITRRILQRIFTKEFAEQVNYSGQNGKIKFSSTLLYDVVKSSVLRHRIAEGSTQRLVEEAVQNWFRYAKGRNRHAAGQQAN